MFTAKTLKASMRKAELPEFQPPRVYGVTSLHITLVSLVLAIIFWLCSIYPVQRVIYDREGGISREIP